MDENKDQDPFDQFEEISEDSKGWDTENTPPQGQEAADIKQCLQIAYNALQGNLNPLLDIDPIERVRLAKVLHEMPTIHTEAALPMDDLPWPVGETKSSASPSDEEASRVVQSPEEAQKEQDFLDTLGI